MNNNFILSNIGLTLPKTIKISLPYFEVNDINNDGFDEVILVQGDPASANVNVWNGYQSAELLAISFVRGNIQLLDILQSSTQIINPTEIILRDFNKDNSIDIFVGDSGVDFAPFPGSAQKLFLSNGLNIGAGAEFGPMVFAHAATDGDIDGDGDTDLFVGGDPGHGSFFLINNGSGQFGVDTNKLPLELSTPSDYLSGALGNHPIFCGF